MVRGEERRAAVFLISVLPPAERRSVRSLYLQQPLLGVKVSVAVCVYVCVCLARLQTFFFFFGGVLFRIGNRPDR